VRASLAACAPPPHTAPFRSPSHDYPPPAPTTADGETIGANRKPVSDTLAERNPPTNAGKR